MTAIRCCGFCKKTPYSLALGIDINFFDCDIRGDTEMDTEEPMYMFEKLGCNAQQMDEMTKLLTENGDAVIAAKVAQLAAKLGEMSDAELELVMDRVDEVAGQHTSVIARRVFRSSRQAYHICTFEIEGETIRSHVTI